jgi:uncharacterized protein (DUF2235 family)
MSEIATVEPPSKTKLLALFLDGTTDRSQGNTNVWRARSLCAAKGRDDREQRIYYAAGVGTQLGEIARGEVLGCGIDDQVVDAYGWLVKNHEDGDEIFVFGFSRGALGSTTAQPVRLRSRHYNLHRTNWAACRVVGGMSAIFAHCGR